MKELVIIEAPGKREHLQQLLKEAGLRHAKVMATIGHLGTNPPGFDPLGIDEHYRETAYRLRLDREKVAHDIREAATTALRIILATDDDQEGDVIARDVCRFCLTDDQMTRVVRVRLRSLAPGEVADALANAQPFDPLSASRGDARRVIDRMIGSLSNATGAVGRVQGSLLLALSEQRPVVGTMTYQVASADGGEPWTAQVPVHAGIPMPLDGLVPGALRAGESRWGTLHQHAQNHDDILLSVSLKTGMTLPEVSEAMQRLYEKGDMTYPRAKDRHVSQESYRRVMAVAKINGAGFNGQLFGSARLAGAGEHAHEAPSSMRLDVPVNRDDVFLTSEESVLVHVTRHLIGCGLACRIEQPLAADLAGLPPEVAEMPWQRVTPMAHHGWLAEPINPGLASWNKAQSLLHFSSTNGLGRPSTILTHVTKFLSRDLVGEAFDLTPKGQQWCNQISTLFGDQNISRLIEDYLETHRDIPEQMVDDMIQLCGLSAIESSQRGLAVANRDTHEYDDDENTALSSGDFSGY